MPREIIGKVKIVFTDLKRDGLYNKYMIDRLSGKHGYLIQPGEDEIAENKLVIEEEELKLFNLDKFNYQVWYIHPEDLDYDVQ
jgi:hypothetical protein